MMPLLEKCRAIFVFFSGTKDVANSRQLGTNPTFALRAAGLPSQSPCLELFLYRAQEQKLFLDDWV